MKEHNIEKIVCNSVALNPVISAGEYTGCWRMDISVPIDFRFKVIRHSHFDFEYDKVFLIGAHYINQGSTILYQKIWNIKKFNYSLSRIVHNGDLWKWMYVYLRGAIVSSILQQNSGASMYGKITIIDDHVEDLLNLRDVWLTL